MTLKALFVLATFFWCWQMPKDLLQLYAASVVVTAVAQWWWK
jgi:hypothetical protein